MGADLIAATFTTDSCTQPSLSHLADYIRAVPAERLTSREFLVTIDPGEFFDENVDAETIRDALISGANEYFAATKGHRHAIGIPIPGTTLWFHFAGGDSWGDDPFDGFTDLIRFIDATDALGLSTEETGIVCGGIPDPVTALRYASNGAGT